MKRVGTACLSVILVLGLSHAAMAQGIMSHRALTPRNSAAWSSHASQVQEPSVVFLPGLKNENPLVITKKDSAFYFQDTSGGNWWLYTAAEDTIGPVVIGLGTNPDGTAHDTTAFDTMYYRVMALRVSTPTDIKQPKIDSASITVFPINISPKDSLMFWVTPIRDEQTRAGNVLPFPDLFSSTNLPPYTPIAKGAVKASALTVGQLNTVTTSFVSHGVGKSLGTKKQFAICVFTTGPDIKTDSIAYQIDANLAPYQGANIVIDTDVMRTYRVSLDEGHLILGSNPNPEFVGGGGGYWTDLPTAADPTQSFNGNLVLVTYFSGTASGGVNGADITTRYRLAENFPNPVSTTSKISYNLAMSGQVTLKVYNTIGDEVTTLVNGVQSAGEHAATFNAGTLPNGFYYYKLQSGEFTETKTMVISR